MDQWAYENGVTLDFFDPANRLIILTLNRSTVPSGTSV